MVDDDAVDVALVAATVVVDDVDVDAATVDMIGDAFNVAAVEDDVVAVVLVDVVDASAASLLIDSSPVCSDY